MNIFLTVGSMLPFDRLVTAVDSCPEIYCNHNIFAQIGDTDYRPNNFKFQKIISPTDYRNHCCKCDLVLSHVGMGTIITALEYGKPLILLPRRPELKEVTNSHQLATARWLKDRPGIRVISSENEISTQIAEIVLFSEKVKNFIPNNNILLTDSIRKFILNDL
jgi:UDP-N-acetylglucosamine transferase subunit ALG13